MRTGPSLPLRQGRGFSCRWPVEHTCGMCKDTEAATDEKREIAKHCNLISHPGGLPNLRRALACWRNLRDVHKNPISKKCGRESSLIGPCTARAQCVTSDDGISSQTREVAEPRKYHHNHEAGCGCCALTTHVSVSGRLVLRTIRRPSRAHVSSPTQTSNLFVLVSVLSYIIMCSRALIDSREKQRSSMPLEIGVDRQ